VFIDVRDAGPIVFLRRPPQRPAFAVPTWRRLMNQPHDKNRRRRLVQSQVSIYPTQRSVLFEATDAGDATESTQANTKKCNERKNNTQQTQSLTDATPRPKRKDRSGVYFCVAYVAHVVFVACVSLDGN